jgi:predicted 3-demethylubiquinone-9 3-methyltransferase (glyoxalase superfamily)
MAVQTKIRPFLLFEGRAEEAMNFYVSLFSGGEITEIVRYASGQAGAERSVMKAVFTVGGQSIMCADSVVQHAFTFSPATSLFVTCESEAEIRRLFAALSEGGNQFMPLGEYGFSRKFAWVSDRFGVSWQLNLEQVTNAE